MSPRSVWLPLLLILLHLIISKAGARLVLHGRLQAVKKVDGEFQLPVGSSPRLGCMMEPMIEARLL